MFATWKQLVALEDAGAIEVLGARRVSVLMAMLWIKRQFGRVPGETEVVIAQLLNIPYNAAAVALAALQSGGLLAEDLEPVCEFTPE